MPGASAAITLIDYLIAADMLVNIEHKLEKLMNFSKRSILYIHDELV